MDTAAGASSGSTNRLLKTVEVGLSCRGVA